MREGAGGVDGDDTELDANLDADLDADLDTGPGDGPGIDGRGTHGQGPGGRGARPRRRRPAALAAVAVVAVVVAALVVGSLVGRSSDGDERGLLDGPVTVEGLFPVLDQQPVAGAAYPGGSLAASLDVVPGSPRPVGSTSTADFWVARSGGGLVCLLARDTRDAEGLGGTCGSAEETAAQGLRLPAGEGVSAVLLPARVARASGSGAPATALTAEGYVRVDDALWVDQDTADSTAEALVDSASVRTVVVPSGARTGSDALPVFLTEPDAPYAVVLACLPDARLRVSVDRGVPQTVRCGSDAAFVPFRGDGGPVRVDVDAPGQPVWAASVVACTGSLLGPVC